MRFKHNKYHVPITNEMDAAGNLIISKNDHALHFDYGFPGGTYRNINIVCVRRSKYRLARFISVVKHVWRFV